MVKIYDKGTKKFLGVISEEELQFLADNLEEESIQDDDYYINRATLEYLVEQGMTPHLRKILEQAMKSRDSVEITWKKVADKSAKKENEKWQKI
jgi:hypothetical protein